jgi:hypothetical protein
MSPSRHKASRSISTCCSRLLSSCPKAIHTYAQPLTSVLCRSSGKDQDSGNPRSSTLNSFQFMQEQRQTIRTCSRIVIPGSQAYQASTVLSRPISSVNSLDCFSNGPCQCTLCSSQSIIHLAPQRLPEPLPPRMCLHLVKTIVSISAVQIREKTGNWIIVVYQPTCTML